MTNLNSPQPVQTSLGSDLLSYARYHLRNRFVLLALGAGFIGLSAYSSWGWLVAAGLAPILLAMAPCAAMCALGMCMKGKKSESVADIASSGAIDGAETKLSLNLAKPGANEGTSLVSNQSAQTRPDNKKGCC